MLLPTSGRTSQASSRPDFTRGFGIDIPEEEEPDDDDYDVVKFASNVFGQPRPRTDTVSEADAASQTDADAEDEGDDHDDATVPAHSRIHSRHQSKLSAALSLRSVGGVRSEGDAADLEERARHDSLGGERNFRSERITQAQVDPAVAEVVAEWTGSEDMRDAVEQSNDEVWQTVLSWWVVLTFLIFPSRAKVNGRTRPTRSVPVHGACRSALWRACKPKRRQLPDGCPTSRARHWPRARSTNSSSSTWAHITKMTTTCTRIRATRNAPQRAVDV